MTDLKDRFRVFDELDPPDLWGRIEEIAGAPSAVHTPRLRPVALVAMAVAVVAFAVGGVEVLRRTVWPDGSDQPQPAYEYEFVSFEPRVLAAPDVPAARAVVEEQGFEAVEVPYYVIPQEREIDGPIGYAALRVGTNDVELGVYADPATLWDLSGKKPGGTWDTFTVDDGIASNGVSGGLAVAADGTVWVGSAEGLSRYDGVTWSVVFSGRGCASVVSGPGGGLWMLMCDDDFNYRVMQFDNERWHEYATINYGEIAVGPDGTVWLADGSVWRFEDGAFEQLTDGETGASLFGITVGGDGVVWAWGPEGGLWRYDGTWTEMPEGHGTELLAAAPDGRVWAGYDAASVFDGTVWTETGLRNSRIVDWAFTPDGTVWAVSPYYGAFRYDGRGWARYTTDDGLASDRLTFVAVGADGAVWFGTEDAGVSRFVEKGR